MAFDPRFDEPTPTEPSRGHPGVITAAGASLEATVQWVWREDEAVSTDAVWDYHDLRRLTTDEFLVFAHQSRPTTGQGLDPDTDYGAHFAGIPTAQYGQR